MFLLNKIILLSSIIFELLNFIFSPSGDNSIFLKRLKLSLLYIHIVNSQAIIIYKSSCVWIKFAIIDGVFILFIISYFEIIFFCEIFSKVSSNL